jgi:hypothetical protein
MMLPADHPDWTSSAKMLDAYDGLIVEHLATSDDEERYRQLRTVTGEEALTISDLEALSKGLLAMAAGRPFDQPTDSSNGSPMPTTGIDSTALSSLRADVG